MLKFAIGTTIGFGLGLAAAFLLIVDGFRWPHVYSVQSISSHYSNAPDGDSQTTLVVYQRGNSGHLEKILCEFPPSLILAKDASGNWKGIKRVRVGSVAERFMFGEIGYICDVVD